MERTPPSAPPARRSTHFANLAAQYRYLEASRIATATADEDYYALFEAYAALCRSKTHS